MMDFLEEEALPPSEWVIQPSCESLGCEGQGRARPQQGLPEPAAGSDTSHTVSQHALLHAARPLPHLQPQGCIPQ